MAINEQHRALWWIYYRYHLDKAWIVIPLLWIVWYCSPEIARNHPPGILVADEPLQGELIQNGTPWQADIFSITPLATYDIRGRVLGKRYYGGLASLGNPNEETGKSYGKLAPYDIAVGWQEMSDSATLKNIKFKMGYRRLQPMISDPADYPSDVIIHKSANIHLLPASQTIENQMAKVRVGDIIHLKGYLIEALYPNSSPWRSSLTRLDGFRWGAKAFEPGSGCEIMWVEELTIE